MGPFRSLFGLTIDEPTRLLTGDDLLHEMLGGYHRLLDYNFGNFTRCIDMFLKSNRPVARIDELRCPDGFGRIEGGSSQEP
jgi:hypothetical protein